MHKWIKVHDANDDDNPVLFFDDAWDAGEHLIGKMKAAREEGDPLLLTITLAEMDDGEAAELEEV